MTRTLFLDKKWLVVAQKVESLLTKTHNSVACKKQRYNILFYFFPLFFFPLLMKKVESIILGILKDDAKLLIPLTTAYKHRYVLPFLICNFGFG